MKQNFVPYVLCPECQRRIDIDDEDKNNLASINVREKEIQCSSGHRFSLFEGIISLGLHPDHYNVFWPLKGVEVGQEQIRVGQWRIVTPKNTFEEIDEVHTIYFPIDDTQLSGVRTEARIRREKPNEFCLMTCGAEEEWGKTINVNWVVYGIVSDTELEIWRENLTYAARHLLAANYRPSVFQSAVAVESFVYELVTGYLRDAKWDEKIIKDYIDGSSIESLSVQGLIRMFIQEIMEINIPKEVFSGWMRLKRMRDALAHGDLVRYKNLSDLNGNKLINDQARAKFAYKSAVSFINEVLYPDK